MGIIYIECPSCGFEGRIDDSFVGKKVKCKECKESFTVEIGGTYDVEPPPESYWPASAKPPEPEPAGKKGKKAAKPPAAQSAADEDREKSFLDKWPEE